MEGQEPAAVPVTDVLCWDGSALRRSTSRRPALGQRRQRSVYGKLPEEVPNQDIFHSLAEAQLPIEA